MRPTSRTPSVVGRVAAAVLLSLGLHGLIVLGVWFAPVSAPTSTAAVDPTQVPQDYPALGLDDAPPPRMPVPPPKRPDPEVKPASFDVKVVDPPLAAPGPAAPIAAGPGAAAPAAGPAPAATAGMGDGSGDGGPCALAVGKDAKTVVYVVDRSMSMGFHGALARARREVLASLRRLPPTARFQLIAYNREAEPLSIDGQSGLLSADEETLRRVADAVSALRRRRHRPRRRPPPRPRLSPRHPLFPHRRRRRQPRRRADGDAPEWTAYRHPRRRSERRRAPAGRATAQAGGGQRGDISAVGSG